MLVVQAVEREPIAHHPLEEGQVQVTFPGEVVHSGIGPQLFVVTWRRARSIRRFPEITAKDNLTVFSYSGRVKSPEMEAAAEKSRSATVSDLQAWTCYYLY